MNFEYLLIVCHNIPQYQFSIHISRGEYLKFGDIWHAIHNRLMAFFEWMFSISFKRPNINSAFLRPTVKYFVDIVPCHTVNRRSEIMLNVEILTLGLHRWFKTILYELPASNVSIAGATKKHIKFGILKIEQIHDYHISGNHKLFSC